MANEEQLSILKQGVDVWNKWREENKDIEIDLSYANLKNADLAGFDLKNARLLVADLSGANLADAELSWASLIQANLAAANFHGATFHAARLSFANLQEADLSEAELQFAYLESAKLQGANLRKADLRDAIMRDANLRAADLTEADLRGANLRDTDLSEANIARCKLNNVDITGATIRDAIISESRIYGINAWDLKGEFKEQNGLIISQDRETVVTVDNIEVAQFIHLILNNTKVRGVLDTLTSKSVLILGRFALPERKVILDTLRNKLREYNLLPIVFDFDRPTDKDFTETVKTLAGLCYFVIADVTNPKSSPLELQATVPDYQIPFVPIIQEGERPFAMMVDLQKKYNWVLNTVSYDSEETLMKVLKPLIIDPAMKKRQELRIIKAQEPEIISAKDFLAKGKA